MRLLCWICQGLGQAQVVRSLGRDLSRLGPDVVFLCETCLHTQHSSSLKTSLNFDSYFMVDTGPGCTSLVLLWNNNTTVTLFSYSSLHIDVSIFGVGFKSFHFTGFHGRFESALKKGNWTLIDQLRTASPLP